MTAGKIRVGVIVGNESDRLLARGAGSKVNVAGNNDTHVVISLVGDPNFTWTRLHLTPSYFRKATQLSAQPFDVLWNAISDADQHPELLKVVDRYVGDFRGAIIDHPSQVKKTRRHQISERLANLPGVHMPKTLLLRNATRDRVARQVEIAGFRFPGILRTTGAHNGETLGVVDDVDGCSAIFGDRKREYYLTEFVDVRGFDDLYRKTRFFFVGDRIIVRQHVVAKSWNIHGRTSREFMVDQPHLLEEARDILNGQFDALSPVTQNALKTIGDTIGMDYFGVDGCMMADGSLVVFEANATMNFNPAFRNPATQYNRAAVPPMTEAVKRLLIRRSAERVRDA